MAAFTFHNQLLKVHLKLKRRIEEMFLPAKQHCPKTRAIKINVITSSEKTIKIDI